MTSVGIKLLGLLEQTKNFEKIFVEQTRYNIYFVVPIYLYSGWKYIYILVRQFRTNAELLQVQQERKSLKPTPYARCGSCSKSFSFIYNCVGVVYKINMLYRLLYNNMLSLFFILFTSLFTLPIRNIRVIPIIEERSYKRQKLCNMTNLTLIHI